MTPTLAGRLQTRIAVAGTVGVVWTAVVTPVLPGVTYGMTFATLALMTFLGLGWEGVYHLVQQARWDKDWPTLVALVTVVNEAVVLWLVAHAIGFIPGPVDPTSPFVAAYILHVTTTWLAMWLFLQGPIRVVLPRWRFNGGLLLTLPSRDTRRQDEVPPRDDTPAVRGRDDAWHHEHVGRPGASHCAVCGTALTGGSQAAVPATPPPLGIIVLPDGTTRIVDGELEIAPIEGNPTLRVTIRPVGWQPVLSSPTTSIDVTLPGGSRLRADAGVPVPLVPGTEFVLGDTSIRFEGAYQAYDLEPAITAPAPAPEPREAPPRPARPRTNGHRAQVVSLASAIAIVVAISVTGAVATGITFAVNSMSAHTLSDDDNKP